MIFGIWKKSYNAKFVLLGTTQPISTSTNFTTWQFHQYEFYAYSTKIRTSGNHTSGDFTSGGPPVNLWAASKNLDQHKTFLEPVKGQEIRLSD